MRRRAIMAKDPICGMDVSEKGARFIVHFEHETCYFCSEKCKETYEERIGLKEAESEKGAVGRFLEKIAKGTEKSYGGKPPKCH